MTESCSTLFNGDVGLDVSLAELPDWHIVYDHPYSHSTQTAELRQLAQQYSNKRIIVGAICGRESTTLALAAMGPADILTLDTPLDKLSKYKNVYWYLTSKGSFGFSATSKTDRVAGVDIEKSDGEKRLSWRLDRSGGYRAGSAVALWENNEWRKIILTGK
ncbi:unnamed protein product [Didymodactylos carnosus]|uniref:Uncharacterized protein n=1 Tax=Didymodactylos carnosus TaxID=1234261 RepID=A0A8S2D4W9_9BILA|nr:unnamed protein product [Didymodactylos carnosus]CAF3663045.1 unnamed protein product [Didymodactylos carnosus]